MREGNTAYCNDCGRMIQFVLTKKNRWMPINCESIAMRPDKDGKLYYKGDRRPVFGRKCDPDDPEAIKAFEPHFYTCPIIIPKRAKHSKAEIEAEATAKAQQYAAAEKARAEKLAAQQENKDWERRQTSIFRT